MCPRYWIQVCNSKRKVLQDTCHEFLEICRCASPKGTLTYSYFPNCEVKAVLGIDDSSNGIWRYPTHRSKVEKYFMQLSWAKMSFYLCIGQINFHVIMLSTQLSMTSHFPPSPFGTTIMGVDQLDWLSHITFAVRSLLIFLNPFVVLHHYCIWFL